MFWDWPPQYHFQNDSAGTRLLWVAVMYSDEDAAPSLCPSPEILWLLSHGRCSLVKRCPKCAGKLRKRFWGEKAENIFYEFGIAIFQ